MIMTYTKKPVVIEAIKLEDSIKSQEECIDFIGGNVIRGSKGSVIITTLEGVIVASVGDYIIKGIQGEFYSCKSDIFEQTYELA